MSSWNRFSYPHLTDDMDLPSQLFGGRLTDSLPMRYGQIMPNSKRWALERAQQDYISRGKRSLEGQLLEDYIKGNNRGGSFLFDYFKKRNTDWNYRDRLDLLKELGVTYKDWDRLPGIDPSKTITDFY